MDIHRKKVVNHLYHGKLNNLVQKGYLTVDTSPVPFIYKLEQHIPH